MGLLSVLQPDLRTLSMEAKKKNPAIKDVSDDVLFFLIIIEDGLEALNFFKQKTHLLSIFSLLLNSLLNEL